MTLTAEQQALATNNLRLAYHVANRTYWQFRKRLSIEDAHSAALEGLVLAAEHFNAALGYQFTTYAHYAILDHLHAAYRRGGIISLPRTPGRHEAACDAARHCSSLDRWFFDRSSERMELLDQTGELNAVEESESFQADLDRLDELLAWLENQDARMAYVLWARFYRGIPLLAVAGTLGISKERVRQIQSTALRLLREKAESIT